MPLNSHKPGGGHVPSFLPLPSAAQLSSSLPPTVLALPWLVLVSWSRSLFFLNEPEAFQGATLEPSKQQINLRVCVLPASPFSLSPPTGLRSKPQASPLGTGCRTHTLFTPQKVKGVLHGQDRWTHRPLKAAAPGRSREKPLLVFRALTVLHTTARVAGLIWPI